MPSDNEALKSKLEDAVVEFATRHGADLAARIGDIARANLRAGRLSFYLDHSDEASVYDYLVLIADNVERNGAYIRAVQVGRSTEVWEPLYIQMQRLAYAFLRKRGLIPGEVTFLLAVDSATDAALNMLNANFPFDTEFEPWLYQFIKHACLKSITRQVRMLKRVADAMDPHEIAEQLTDPRNGRIDWEIFMDLAQAIGRLSAKRRQVLALRYGQGLPSSAVAKLMDSTVNAVNKLHHDAIKQLQDMLTAAQE